MDLETSTCNLPNGSYFNKVTGKVSDLQHEVGQIDESNLSLVRSVCSLDAKNALKRDELSSSNA
jgi:hypothetical protein